MSYPPAMHPDKEALSNAPAGPLLSMEGNNDVSSPG